MVPGFVVAHLHLGALTEERLSAQTRFRAGVRSIDDLAGWMGAAASGVPPGTWIRGKG